nr:GNAT family N-acetyltransferase [Lysobacter sp. CAU 1642]
MNPEHPEPRHEPAQSRFIIDDSRGQAVLEYRLGEGRVDFTRTFVPPTMRGGGVAARLVDAGLAWAEREGLEPLGSCSYVGAALAKRKR